jgi:hypothetical protein
VHHRLLFMGMCGLFYDRTLCVGSVVREALHDSIDHHYLAFGFCSLVYLSSLQTSVQLFDK